VNFNYLYSSRIFICIPLDKTFKFFSVLVRKINPFDEKNPFENLKLFRNCLECLYLITFFLRIFKVSDLTAETSEELEVLRAFFLEIRKNQNTHVFIIKFLMKNVFNYLHISFESTLNPLFKFSKNTILEICEESNDPKIS